MERRQIAIYFGTVGLAVAIALLVPGTAALARCAFAIVAPIVGWLVGLLFSLEATAGRAIAFSTGTRNSLVVLPLALAVPGAIPVLPAVIVTQTLVELLSELVYVQDAGGTSAHTYRLTGSTWDYLGLEFARKSDDSCGFFTHFS